MCGKELTYSEQKVFLVNTLLLLFNMAETRKKCIWQKVQTITDEAAKQPV